MNAERQHRVAYIACDYVMTSVAWLLFNLVRYHTLDEVNFSSDLLDYMCYPVVMWGQVLIPLAMMAVYWLSGFYNKTFCKSRLEVFTATLFSILIGAIGIYFAAIIDDPIPDRFSNYTLIAILIGLMTCLVLSGRLTITTVINKAIASGKLSQKVIFVGTREKIQESIHRINGRRSGMGYVAAGAVLTDGRSSVGKLPVYDPDNLQSVCETDGISAIIIATDRDRPEELLNIVRRVFPVGLPVLLPAWVASTPLTRIRTRSVAGEPLTDISASGLTESQHNIKRLTDIAVSALTLLLLSPVMATIAYMVRRDSKGPVFYAQERIGRHRRRFNIYKFRTMIVNSEPEGPALSSENDPRVTHIGQFLRKYRLDELPQFWNVLKGDMSLVGPRPEREYYEDLIIKRAPHYTLLHQLRPGITSWGMVKYGYASNVDEMIERLDYDMIYLDNASLLVDIKIMFYTLRTVITGQGV